VPFGRLALTGLTAVLIWNFLFGPTLVKILTDYPAMLASKRTFWLGSMLLLITTGLLVLIEIIRKPAPANDANTPFLRTPLMVLVFTMVLLGAAGAHLYALGYQFDIPFKTGDFILLATLGIVLFLEIMRPFEPGLKEFIAVMGCAPLVGTGIVLTNHAFSVPFQWGLEMLGHPSTIIVLGGLGMMRMALKSNWLPYWCITGVYGLSFLLTAFSPAAPTELNWRLCFGLVIIVAFAAGLILKRPGLCMTSVVLSGIGLGASDTFSQLLTGIGLSQPGGVLGYCGLGFIAVGIAFKDKTLLPMVIIGAAALTGTTFDFVGPTIGWRDFIALGVLLTTASLLWWRLRDYVTLAILTIPVVVRLWLLFRTLSTWRYVVLSFILLGIGAWISTLKNRKGK
jgi:hypothetical protein